jgi:flagellar biosynthesis/type III secretory pathway chaperone
MGPLLTELKAGAALYAELGALLDAEREPLARHELAAVEDANARRKDLLERIADWESAALERLAPTPDGHGPETLGAAVRALPAAERPKVEAALADLKAAAEAARHAAAVNHILVERNLDTVSRTLDILTGRPSRLTYGPGGGVNPASGGGLVARKG